MCIRDREAFNAADLDFDLESVCFDDPEGVLNLTQYTPVLSLIHI